MRNVNGVPYQPAAVVYRREAWLRFVAVALAEGMKASTDADLTTSGVTPAVMISATADMAARFADAMLAEFDKREFNPAAAKVQQ